MIHLISRYADDSETTLSLQIDSNKNWRENDPAKNAERFGSCSQAATLKSAESTAQVEKS